MVSDRLPYVVDPIYNISVQFIAQFMNDTATWLGLSILVGYLFCSSKKQAALAGWLFAVFSIVVYFVFSELLPSQAPVRIAAESNEITAFARCLFTSAFGGVVGGLIGFYFEKAYQCPHDFCFVYCRKISDVRTAFLEWHS